MHKNRDIFGLFLWMDSSKIETFKEIMAGRQQLPKDRLDIIYELDQIKTTGKSI